MLAHLKRHAKDAVVSNSLDGFFRPETMVGSNITAQRRHAGNISDAELDPDRDRPCGQRRHL
ncbi:hypothetical protein CUJ84_Chr001346 [Rhizobium leguminosarum]|uniref:Uncharacterized protein n=1 Tax=Rhizobium leguminosarum TaxID=384 RepID=A0A2K9Z0I3_RHILE|nr:hypothetical protein CUJ84_Chr001346 [Rhizobium leguminosarum]